MFRINFIGLVLAGIVLTGCQSTYMDLNTSSKKEKHLKTIDDLDSLSRANRYFILRSGMRSWHLDSVVVAGNRSSVSAKLVPVSSEHRLHIKNPPDGVKRYNPGDALEQGVVNEIHLHVSLLLESWKTSRDHYTIPLDSLTDIEVLAKGPAKMNPQTTKSVVAIVGAIALIGLILVAASHIPTF